MEFSSFTLIVTEDCNFNCSYCYQKKRKRYVDIFTVEKCLDFFSPFLKKDCYINFYGGEPLLAFDKMKHAVLYLNKKNLNIKTNIHYTFSTNGSLINNEILEFLSHYKISPLVSFDGLAQEICRKKGSFKKTVTIIEKILKMPNIRLETNSVFTPETVGYLSKSIQFIMEMGVPHIALSLSTISPWNPSSLLLLRKELASLKEFLLSFYKKTKTIPLIEFRKSPNKGIFGCFAGKDRMALTPGGQLWGCYLFPDYFKGKEETFEYLRYCFGGLETFIENHEKVYPEILSNYSSLRIDHFYTADTFCMLCDELEGCQVCPIETAFSSSIIRKIPIWTCNIQKILRNEKELFWRELES